MVSFLISFLYFTTALRKAIARPQPFCPKPMKTGCAAVWRRSRHLSSGVDVYLKGFTSLSRWTPRRDQAAATVAEFKG
jgi:hypothetical protein